MSISKHADNLLKIQVSVDGKTVQKYSRNIKEAEAINKKALDEAKNSGSYIFQKRKRNKTDRDEDTVTSTMPLLCKDGAPRYFHVIAKRNVTQKKGMVTYYSIVFKFLGKRDEVIRKAFSIAKGGFEVSFREAVNFGAKSLELTRKQKAIWVSGKSKLKEKYEQLKEAEKQTEDQS